MSGVVPASQLPASMVTTGVAGVNLAGETVTGQFYPDGMVDAPKQVGRADSIENRVQKLLAGPVALAPAGENWGQFLDAPGGVR